MVFFVYENWIVRPKKARIHTATCKFCNHGLGIHHTYSKEHGQWLGPFETHDEAIIAATQTLKPVSECKKCLNK